MKFAVVASLSLAVLICANPCFAKDDPLANASFAAGCAGLSAVAVPVFLTQASVNAVGSASEGIVTIVDKGGEGLSELTLETLDDLNEATSSDANAPRVQVNKKEIPLAVRKDYLQLNQKVKTE